MNDETRNTEDAAATGETSERNYALQRIYLKDASFESPNSPDVFAKEWKPQVSMNISTRSRPVDNDVYEVVLTITCEAKQDDKTAFLIELHQAGVFLAKGFAPDELHQILGVHCPQNLFPFAREAIADLTLKGGFPQILLQPINFDMLYRKNLEERANSNKAGNA
jgi:preprotein translocase subunit SecB